MSFKSGVKGRGSDTCRWWERRLWLWWGDICRMRWTRRRLNKTRLTEWRRELIPQVRWCISKRAVGDLQWGRYGWSSQGDNRCLSRSTDDLTAIASKHIGRGDDLERTARPVAQCRWLPAIINPLTPTVAMWVRLYNILCQIGLGFRLSFVIFDIRTLWRLALSVRVPGCQKQITNDGLTRSGTGYCISVPIWQQWASKD